MDSLKREADTVAADCRRLLGPARRSLRSLQALGEAPKQLVSDCTNAQEVRELMRIAIEARGPMTPQELQTAVGEAIRRRGKTLKMFGSLFKRCLNEQSFGRDGDRITVTDPTDP